MRLISLEFVPRGANGWESPILKFADRTTSLFAPNGSGKTPVIQAIAYSLGFATTFREDIRDHCSEVILSFEHNEIIYEIRRELSKDFHLRMISESLTREFFSEGDFSMALFQSLDLQAPVLISTSRQSTKPYISTILPLFYVKQDGGYLDAYKASATFIQDQFVEMVRFVFGLAPKRSYTAQKDLLDAKDKLELIQSRVVHQQKVVADLWNRVDDSPKTREMMEARSLFLTDQLKQLRESMHSTDAADNALQDLLSIKDEKLKALKRQYFEISNRVAGIEAIRAEIEGEIQTLSLNEQSKRAFESFGDVCNQANCGLFLSSTESYAKNLMYLKDQIKDLESNTTRAEFQLAELQKRIEEEEQERTNIVSKIKTLPQKSVTHQLVEAVEAITKELLEIGQQKAQIDILIEARTKYMQLDNERSRIQDSIASLSNNTRGELEFNKLRAKIRESLVHWMDSLHTLNVSPEVDIDHNFKFKFGTESLDVFTGSTRSRLILAIHAAIFEAYLENPNNPFRFLILDTPKQHELNGQDLANYLQKLQAVCIKYDGQIIISSTEYRHAIGDCDTEWLPKYPGTAQPMYLGKPGSRIIDN